MSTLSQDLAGLLLHEPVDSISPYCSALGLWFTAYDHRAVARLCNVSTKLAEPVTHGLDALETCKSMCRRTAAGHGGRCMLVSPSQGQHHLWQNMGHDEAPVDVVLV